MSATLVAAAGQPWNFDERRRSPGFVARWQGYYELVREMIPDAQHAGVGLLAGSDSGANG